MTPAARETFAQGVWIKLSREPKAGEKRIESTAGFERNLAGSQCHEHAESLSDV
jgi:hypothetical protein